MNTAAEQIPETKPQRRSFLLCILFLICALLWNPEIYSWQLKFTYLPFFTTGALAFLAVGIIVLAPPEFRPLRKFMLIAEIAFCLLLLGQCLMFPSSLTMAKVGEAFWWIVIPTLVYTHRRSFHKLLPVYVLTVGGYGFLHFAVRGLRGIWSAGITGNVNWTAALSVMTMIFLGWLIRERFAHSKSARKRKMILCFGIAGELLLFCGGECYFSVIVQFQTVLC